MSLPDRAGTFKAHPVEWGMHYSDKGTAVLDIQFAIDEWQSPDTGEWWDWREHDNTITGYYYFEKNDGTINETAVNQLKHALGWDGLNVKELQLADWTQTPVQLVLAYETFEKKERLKLKWLNNIDGSGGGGGIKPVEDQDLVAMQGKLGPKLRALAGPVTQGAPPPASRPPAPPHQGGSHSDPAATPEVHKPVDESEIPF